MLGHFGKLLKVLQVLNIVLGIEDNNLPFEKKQHDEIWDNISSTISN